MELIKDYVDRFFKRYPNTQRYRDAKKHILELMSRRFKELIDQSYAEHDAFCVVLEEYGNLEIITEELGHRDIINDLDQPMNSFDANAYLQNAKPFSKTASISLAIILSTTVINFLMGFFKVESVIVRFVILPIVFLIPSIFFLVRYFEELSNYKKQERGDVQFETDELKFVFEQERLQRNAKNKNLKINTTILFITSIITSILMQIEYIKSLNVCLEACGCVYNSCQENYFIQAILMSVLFLLIITFSAQFLINCHIEDYAYYRLLGGIENNASKQNLTLGGVFVGFGILFFTVFSIVMHEYLIVVDVWPWIFIAYLVIAPWNYAVKSRKLKNSSSS
jgi:hypothetical protein